MMMTMRTMMMRNQRMKMTMTKIRMMTIKGNIRLHCLTIQYLEAVYSPLNPLPLRKTAALRTRKRKSPGCRAFCSTIKTKIIETSNYMITSNVVVVVVSPIYDVLKLRRKGSTIERRVTRLEPALLEGRKHRIYIICNLMKVPMKVITFNTIITQTPSYINNTHSILLP
jgi:hypothetical protein